MLSNILLVGFGDLGAHIASLLLASNYHVTGVRRSQQLYPHVTMISADVSQADCLPVLRKLQPDILIYCVAASGQSDAQYQSAYVDGLRHVLESQQNNLALKHVFFVSSTRVYGQISSQVLDENVPAVPADFGGERLLQAEQLLDALSIPTTVLRLSGIYGPGRLRMIQLAQDPDRWPSQNSWTNRIHRDDAAAFIFFLIEQLRVSPPSKLHQHFIVTDSAPVSQYEVIDWLASQLNPTVRLSPPTSRVLAGKRLSNQQMLATGFKLRYPTYKEGYQALLDSL